MAGRANSILPFTEDGIQYLRDRVEGNARRFIKIAFALVEQAAISFTSGDDRIDRNFIYEL
jgi:hypothetical protein